MYTNLVISGGGVKGVALLGCVEVLERYDMLKSIKNYIGCSIGSVVSLMLVCNYSYTELKDFVYTFVLNEINEKQIDVNNMFGIFTTYGLDNGSIIYSIVDKLLTLKNLDVNISFMSLTKKTGKNLIITGANISDSQYEYFSVDTTPDMSIKTAIRISTSYPIIFTPVIYNEKYYVDAGLYNNFPLQYFLNNVNTTIGISFASTQHNSDKEQPFQSFIEYIIHMITSVLTKMTLLQSDHQLFSEHICLINIPDVSLINFDTLAFNLDESMIMNYIQIGKEQMEKFLNHERRH